MNLVCVAILWFARMTPLPSPPRSAFCVPFFLSSILHRVFRQADPRFRRPRSNTANGLAGSATVSPKPCAHKRSSGGGGEEWDETVREFLPWARTVRAYPLQQQCLSGSELNRSGAFKPKPFLFILFIHHRQQGRIPYPRIMCHWYLRRDDAVKGVRPLTRDET